MLEWPIPKVSSTAIWSYEETFRAYDETPQLHWALEDPGQSFLPSTFGEMCNSVRNGLKDDNSAEPTMQQVVCVKGYAQERDQRIVPAGEKEQRNLCHLVRLR